MTGSLIGRLAILLTRLAHRHGTHRYLSTGCLHGEHAYCQGNTGKAGAKKPASCKWCGTGCLCPCHRKAGR